MAMGLPVAASGPECFKGGMIYSSIVTLGFGLSMDAFAAALGQGAANARPKWPQALLVGFAFGLAQAMMPVIGWLMGVTFHDLFKMVDHWIAFVLLAYIGGQMMHAGLKPPEMPAPASGKRLALLALATSIDAAVAGMTLAFLDVPLPIACLIIGGITFVLSTTGVLIGRAAGVRFGNWAEIFGGLVLIALGTKILVEHVFLI
jgi:manganese efflux pump family protein